MPINDPDDLRDGSTKALAALLGITERAVYSLHQKGVITQLRRGRYDLVVSVQAYHARGTETTEKSESGARRLLLVQQERKLKLENDEKEKQLIPIAEAAGAVQDFAARLVAGITALPGRLARPLAAMDKPGEIKKFLNDEINGQRQHWYDALEDLQDVEPPRPDDDGAGEGSSSARARKKSKRVGRRKQGSAKRKRRTRAVEK